MALSKQELASLTDEMKPFLEDSGVPEHDHMPFAYYFSQAPEGSVPEYTWGMLDRGMGKQSTYPGVDLELVDMVGDTMIPNYRRRVHGLRPVLDVMKPLAEDIDEALKEGSILAFSNHPTIPTPIIHERSFIEAMLPGRPDIQQHTYTVYGLLPTTFRYNLKRFATELSPTGVSLALGNLLVTAAVSDSNMQPELKEWQTQYRKWFTANLIGLLSVPGNVVFLVASGQRDIHSTMLPKGGRIIHQPEGDTGLYVRPGIKVLNTAFHDHLLEDTDHPGSPVEMYVNPHLQDATKRVIDDLNLWQARTLDTAHDGTRYYEEGFEDLARRMSDRANQLMHRNA